MSASLPPPVIYLDYNATTPVEPLVMNEMLPWFLSAYGNPASDHLPGWQAAEKVEECRQAIGRITGFPASGIIFTSGATEALNLLLHSFAGPGRHIVTAASEHKAVLAVCAQLAARGTKISRLPVDNEGLVDPDRLAADLRPETSLVCLMQANNETGVLQPMADIAEVCRKHGVPLASDTTQALGKLPASSLALADMVVGSAHKMYGPKGVGFLAVKEKWLGRIKPLQAGGGQEGGRRPGTLNVPGIVGLTAALEWSMKCQQEKAKQLATWRDDFEQRLQARLNVRINGANAPRLPNTTNICFTDVEADRLLQRLAARLAASRGSACSARGTTASHVLLAMGLPEEQAHTAIRFSLGYYTTREELEQAVVLLTEAVESLR